MPPGMRHPETLKLDLPDGNWLLVKKFLTAGELRQQFRLMMGRDTVGRNEIDPVRVGPAKIITYLLDWSITDADDQALVVRGADDATVLSLLDNLDGPVFADVLEAVEQHEAAMDAMRDAEKKTRRGEMKSSPTSTSPDSSAGDTNGSETLTEMSSPFSSVN